MKIILSRNQIVEVLQKVVDEKTNYRYTSQINNDNYYFLIDEEYADIDSIEFVVEID